MPWRGRRGQVGEHRGHGDGTLWQPSSRCQPLGLEIGRRDERLRMTHHVDQQRPLADRPCAPTQPIAPPRVDELVQDRHERTSRSAHGREHGVDEQRQPAERVREDRVVQQHRVGARRVELCGQPARPLPHLRAARAQRLTVALEPVRRAVMALVRQRRGEQRAVVAHAADGRRRDAHRCHAHRARRAIGGAHPAPAGAAGERLEPARTSPR